MNKQQKAGAKMNGASCFDDSIFLPQIALQQKNFYRKNPKSKAKNPRKKFWYTDYYISMTLEEAEKVVALMDERARFAGLKDFVQKVCKTDNKDYSTRFIINAQTLQDCFLAVTYINYHLCRVSYHAGGNISDYSRTHMYQNLWRYSSLFQAGTDFSVNQGMPVKEKDDDSEDSETVYPSYLDKPLWYDGDYPLFLDSQTCEFGRIVQDMSLIEKYDLIYVLESRNKSDRTKPDSINSGGFEFWNIPDKAAPRKLEETLILSGFKRIYISDTECDELRGLFSTFAASMQMRLSKTLRFDLLKKEYDSFLQTENDVLRIAKGIKERKIFDGKPNSAITYKDFYNILDVSAAATEFFDSKRAEIRKESPWDELNALIGNEGIKRDVRRMVDALLLDKRRRELGLPGTVLTMHSLFFGAPGTSKTTVSRMIAKILKHEGIIKGDAFRECTKSDVVGKYVGWTAEAVDKIFSDLAEAGGGVLFLDEAYTYSQDPTSFDREAITCIVQGMENHREIMCIFAGYKEPMKQFVEANPGLRSRIGFVFEFSDYDPKAMLEIAKYQARILGFILPEGCGKMLMDYFFELKNLQSDGWGNGREARKILEQASLLLAERLARRKRKPTKEDCTRLAIEDIENAIRNSLDREYALGKDQHRRIGFAG